jgi:hypothetical protein
VFQQRNTPRDQAQSTGPPPTFLNETLGTPLACLLCADNAETRRTVFEGDVVRFHTERDKRLHPMRDTQMHAPTPASKSFVNRRYGFGVKRPIERSQRSKFPLHDNGIVDDLLVISMCYEVHLSMQQMLAAFAQIRGDDTVDSIG